MTETCIKCHALILRVALVYEQALTGRRVRLGDRQAIDADPVDTGTVVCDDGAWVSRRPGLIPDGVTRYRIHQCSRIGSTVRLPAPLPEGHRDITAPLHQRRSGD